MLVGGDAYSHRFGHVVNIVDELFVDAEVDAGDMYRLGLGKHDLLPIFVDVFVTTYVRKRRTEDAYAIEFYGVALSKLFLEFPKNTLRDGLYFDLRYATTLMDTRFACKFCNVERTLNLRTRLHFGIAVRSIDILHLLEDVR